MAGFVMVEDRVLDSAAASITFNAGLTDYTKFRLTLYVVKDENNEVPTMRVNGDTGSNYAYQRLLGRRTGATGNRFTSQSSFQLARVVNSNSTALITVEISKPLTSTPARISVSTSTITSAGIEYMSYGGEWNNTADLISSLTLIGGGNNFAAGTRAVLEGAPGHGRVTYDHALRVVVGDAIQGEDYSTGTEWPEDYESVNLDPIPLDGLTPSDVNDGFGVALATDVTDGGLAEVDALPLDVSYNISVSVVITEPEGTLDSPNALLQWTAEVGGEPVTQATYRVVGRLQPSNVVIYDSGTISSAIQEHQIGSGSPVVPWANPQNGQAVRWTVTLTEDGTADPAGIGDPIAGSASVDTVTAWTPLPAITGLTATAVTEEA